MRTIDLVKIRGYTDAYIPDEAGEQGVSQFYEVLQGIGFSMINDQAPATPISNDDKISEALWKAQNTVIKEDSAYIRKIAALLEEKLAEVPKEEGIIDNILDTIREWADEVIIAPIVKWVITKFIKASPYGRAAMFAGYVLGAIAVKYLKELYAAWKNNLYGLIAENDALLDLEMTRENYALRNAVLLTHTEKIENILHHAALLEGQAKSISPLDSMTDLTQAVKDLQYNDEMADFGTMKLYLKGKSVEKG